MALDSFLHVFIGGFLTVFFLSYRIPAKIVFLFIFLLAIGKEFYDHLSVLGHCWPSCMDEHIRDMFFSFLFFLFYVPTSAIIRNIKGEKISYKHYMFIWIILSFLQLSLFGQLEKQAAGPINTLIALASCKVN